MKLSDSASMILLAAANHPQHLARLPEKLPRAAANAVFRSLIKQDFLIEMTAPRDLVGLGWRQDEDGSWIVAKITDDGMRAIGLDPNEGDADPATAATAPDTAPHAAPADQPPEDDAAEQAAQGAPEDAVQGHDLAAEDEAEDDRPRHERLGISEARYSGVEEERLLDAALADPAPRSSGLRKAAQTMLDAWDASPAQDATDNPITRAVETLRAAMGSKPIRTPRAPGAPRKPREGTKQEQVLAMLRRPEGATVAQIAEATGWAQHTVRGFFAGLKKKGHAVEVIERVRQVGPNKEGARGSYTVYRIAG